MSIKSANVCILRKALRKYLHDQKNSWLVLVAEALLFTVICSVMCCTFIVGQSEPGTRPTTVQRLNYC